MAIDAIPLLSYNGLNIGPFDPKDRAWGRTIPPQVIVDYADHRFGVILLAWRQSQDALPFALLRKEYVWSL